jgi:hypothetical protein
VTLHSDQLKTMAQRAQARAARRRRDVRYLTVLGRFVAARLLVTNQAVPRHRKPIWVTDALWAGEVEPRIIELLPALLIKKPSLFVDPNVLPEDVAKVVKLLRRGKVPEQLRGIPGPDLARWLPRVGHREHWPSLAKTFRLKRDDVRLLERLAADLHISEAEVVRRGVRALAGTTYLDTAEK